jgi:hypothetical protein
LTGARVKAALGAVAIVLALGALAQAEVVQRGNVRVSFDGRMSPRSLPRSGTASIAVSVGGTIETTDNTIPPQLLEITIGINRHGRIDTTGLPVCRMARIQPSTTGGAMRICGASFVGEGDFSSKILLPQQAPFPSDGRVLAFNGIYRGRPAILAHIYGTKPAPISFTLPFVISRGKGTFATTLSASLPHFTSRWGYVTGLEMTLGRKYSYRGRPRSYVSAGCPAPAGFPSAVFPLARADYRFDDGRHLSSTLVRTCSVRR